MSLNVNDEMNPDEPPTTPALITLFGAIQLGRPTPSEDESLVLLPPKESISSFVFYAKKYAPF